MKDLNTPLEDQAAKDQSGNIFDQPEGVDWLLVFVILLAENAGIEMGVTVSLNGQLITGRVISGEKYVAALAESMKSANVTGSATPRDDLGSIMSEAFEGFKAVYSKTDQGGPHSVQRTFLHMQDVKILAGNRVLNSGLWRIDLSKVGGFSLSTLSFD